jgi:hypothetical protein
MRRPPRLHALHVLRPAEVVAIFRSLQPPPLTRHLARAPTLRRYAVALAFTLPRIGNEGLVTMATLALPDGLHARSPSRDAPPATNPSSATLRGSRGKKIHPAEEELFSVKLWKKIDGRIRDFQTASFK